MTTEDLYTLDGGMLFVACYALADFVVKVHQGWYFNCC